MLNEIYTAIQSHLSLLDLALQTSSKIKFFASNSEVEQVLIETENRERLVNVITQIQGSIENKISALGPQDLQEDTLPILKSWFMDLANWSEKMVELDRENVELLNQKKEDTTKEIATIFRNKELFKGYNQSIKK